MATGLEGGGLSAGEATPRCQRGHTCDPGPTVPNAITSKGPHSHCRFAQLLRQQSLAFPNTIGILQQFSNKGKESILKGGGIFPVRTKSRYGQHAQWLAPQSICPVTRVAGVAGGGPFAEAFRTSELTAVLCPIACSARVGQLWLPFSLMPGFPGRTGLPLCLWPSSLSSLLLQHVNSQTTQGRQTCHPNLNNTQYRANRASCVLPSVSHYL